MNATTPSKLLRLVRDKLNQSSAKRGFRFSVLERWDKDGWIHYAVKPSRAMNPVDYYPLLAEVEEDLRDEVDGANILLVPALTTARWSKPSKGGSAKPKRAATSTIKRGRVGSRRRKD